jgi:hypothetical protein
MGHWKLGKIYFLQLSYTFFKGNVKSKKKESYWHSQNCMYL